MITQGGTATLGFDSLWEVAEWVAIYAAASISFRRGTCPESEYRARLFYLGYRAHEIDAEVQFQIDLGLCEGRRVH